MATRLYIHETIEISVEHRTAYLDHFCRSWGPRTRELYGWTCFGVWGTIGTTSTWPEAIVLWELASPDALTDMLSGAFAERYTGSTPISHHFGEFWGGAPEGVVPRRGVDRLLVPTAGSPSVTDLMGARVGAVGYYHETIRVRPGAAGEFLRRYESEWCPIVAELGLRLLGAYRTLFRNDSEAIALWALTGWPAWYHVADGLRDDPRARAFREATRHLDVDWDGKLLRGARDNPLDTGVLL